MLIQLLRSNLINAEQQCEVGVASRRPLARQAHSIRCSRGAPPAYALDWFPLCTQEPLNRETVCARPTPVGAARVCTVSVSA